MSVSTLEAKTVSISLQLNYAQILELALQLMKEDKEQLMKDLGDSLARECKEESKPSIEEPTTNYNSTTVEEIKAGKSTYKPVGKGYLKKLQEEAQEIWEDEPLTDAEINEQIKKHL